MSQDLLTQLAEYGEFCEERQWSVTADEVFDDAFGGVTSLQSRPRRGWLIGVAGAVAVLGFGLITLLTRQTPPEAPVASQPSPSPTVSTPAPAPSPTVATPAPVPSAPIEGSVSGWSRIPHDEAVFGDAVMWGVTAGGPGLVAVGGESFWLYDPGDIHHIVWASSEYEVGSGDAVVWTSPDGITWSRVPNDETVFGGDGEQQMLSVTAGGPGLVAVGFDGGLDNRGSDAAVWTSVDGIVWSRIPHVEAVFGGDGQQRMLSVTVGGPGLVAVGFDTTLDADRADAAVWTSVDGITWSRVPHDEAVFGGDNAQQMLSVTSGGPGLVAVGNDGTSGGPGLVGVGNDGYADQAAEKADSDAAVWTSPDGITWSRVRHDELVFGRDGQQQMLSVTAGGPGLVAVGFDRGLGKQGSDAFGNSGSDAVVWTSPDGITWSRVPHDEAVFGGTHDDEHEHHQSHERMTSVASGGPGVVAVGSRGLDGPFGSGVWTSPDGITWSRTGLSPLDGYSRMFDVTVGDSGLVAVGRGGSLPNAAVWVAGLED